jgi:hypothetical protein
MTPYTITLVFADVDDNYYTKGQATMSFPINADDDHTAQNLGQRLQSKFGADHLIVKIGVEE